MALNYDLGDIKDYETLCYYEREGETHLHPNTEHLIWGCMSVDMPVISEKNCDEFFLRCQMVAAAWLYTNDKSYMDRISFKNIHDHIGLRTNVSMKPITHTLKRCQNIMKADDYYRHQLPAKGHV
tara:strand:- start:595 stop:969 length:375 start_codon:yes stop_codon:yes gene_type:complete